MSIGQTLLQLQELDLSLARLRRELEDMPEIASLAHARRDYKRLRSEAMKLLAQRKDLETEIADLDDRNTHIENSVTNAQRMCDPTSAREVQELEIELSTFAKELEKIAFAREDLEKQLGAVKTKQEKLQEFIERFEQQTAELTRTARDRAKQLTDQIARSEAQRLRLLAELPTEHATRYEQAHKRFSGLGVEELQGSVPSICRTALQASSLDGLNQHEVTQCPYCHRILITQAKE